MSEPGTSEQTPSSAPYQLIEDPPHPEPSFRGTSEPIPSPTASQIIASHLHTKSSSQEPDHLIPSRRKCHPVMIYKRLKRQLNMFLHPFVTNTNINTLAIDVLTHRHTICSLCKTNVSYDIWGSCTSPSDREERILDGPCSHYVTSGQEARLKHDWYTCDACWFERGEHFIVRQRDVALQRQGWIQSQSQQCMWRFTAPREGGGKPVFAPWRDVRVGPCGYVPAGFASMARKEEIKEMRRGHGQLGPVLNLEALKPAHDASVAEMDTWND
ncbi:hypothetical protein VTL71DRAFT_2995 [Oculimacula yallundae]|uniref:Uncharacterized protein n=1 Tax=Oculimacula yallundae TaxID=86028 RepID=A0ABR4C7P9_9HELO